MAVHAEKTEHLLITEGAKKAMEEDGLVVPELPTIPAIHTEYLANKRWKHIPANLLNETLEKYAAGMTAPDLVEWLEEEHGVITNTHKIRSELNKARDARKAITKAIYTAEVSKTAIQDLQLVGDMIEDLEKQFLRHKKNNPAIANNYAKTLLQYLDYRKSLLGWEETPQITNIDKAVIFEGLAAKLKTQG